ncbi:MULTISPECIES: dTMP kinase [unclassified Lysobacter]
MSLQVQPRLLSLEGGEGAGKSTVMAALAEALRVSGASVVCTREPGGTPMAEQIRNLLLHGGDEHPAPETEMLLMFAARSQHVRQRVLPALQRGDWVISDRFTDASYAYQGAARGGDPDFIAELERRVVGIVPGLTLLLDVPVQLGLQRVRGRGNSDRIEAEADDFFERVRAAYLARAAADPSRFRVIDASQSPDTVASEAIAHLRAYQAALA